MFKVLSGCSSGFMFKGEVQYGFLCHVEILAQCCEYTFQTSLHPQLTHLAGPTINMDLHRDIVTVQSPFRNGHSLENLGFWV